MFSNLQAKLSSKIVLHVAQISLLAVFVAVSVAVSLTSSEGPDEVAHYYFNRFVAKYGRLPVNTTERLEAGYKADLPPLFYLAVGLAGRGINLDAPPFLKINRDNPRLQLVTGHGNITGWRIIKTEDPFRGEILLWYLGRWITLVTGLAALVVTYILLLKTNPGQPWLALGAVSVLAFLPTYTYISGVTGYEPLTGMLLALYFLTLFYLIQYPQRGWLYFGAGLLIGLTASARQTPWTILPVVSVLIFWLTYRQRWVWWRATGYLLFFGLGVLLTFGGWILYIAVYFNRVAELGWFQGLISPILIGDGSGRTSLQIASMMTSGDLGVSDFSKQSDSIWQWGWRFFSGIWGRSWFGWLMVGVWGAALVGLIRRWRREIEPTRLWIVLLAGHIGLLLFFPLLRFIFSGQASTAMSQHLLFPAAAAMMVLLVYGLGTWRTPGYLTGLLFVLAAVYLGQSIAAIPRRASEPFPIQTLPLSPDEHILVSFDNISLIDYQVGVADWVLPVTLFWRTEDFLATDYQITLTLLDSAGQPQSRWVGQPLNGRYPSRAWQPGDRIRHEVYLPMAGLPPGEYQLQLQVWGDEGVVATADGEAANLGPVALTPAQAVATENLALGEQTIAYTLWQQDQPATAPPLYGENATVVFSTKTNVSDNVKLNLVGPDGRAHAPVDQTSLVYNFSIAPDFADGDYHLRAEQWAGDKLVAQAETPSLLQVETEPRQFEIPSISQPLAANFAGYVTLLGYDLPQPHVQPGDVLPVMLYWQTVRVIGADLVTFSRLIDDQQQVWAERDRIPREVYSTMLWAPGEIVADPFKLQVDANAPAGIYYLLIGLYLPVGESAVSLPLVQDGQFSEVTHVRIGPVYVGEPNIESD
jgi:hypothetical protein